LEHLAPGPGRCSKTNRVLADDGQLFVYTRSEEWMARRRCTARQSLARGLERLGLLDLRQEQLHIRPRESLVDHDDLAEVVREWLRIGASRATPIIGSFVEHPGSDGGTPARARATGPLASSWTRSRPPG
jgi:hypothetical protein